MGVQIQNHGLYGNIFSNIGAWPLVPNSFACCNKDCIRSHPWTQFSTETEISPLPLVNKIHV